MAKRRVEYDGTSYAVRRDDVAIPDLVAMARIDALIWLNRNTYAKGRSTVAPNPLAGMAGAIAVRIQ